MASYKVLFKKSAEKELRAVPSYQLPKIIEKIKSLSGNPRPHGSELLKGDERYFRVRQNDYRIIYGIDDPAEEIIIIKIGHRREVYK